MLYDILTTSYNMSFFDHSDDVKSIIAKHLTNDQVINKYSATEPDDDLQKILFNKEKAMDMHVEDIFIDFKKNFNKFDDETEFF
jgi:hypothetical protein